MRSQSSALSGGMSRRSTHVSADEGDEVVTWIRGWTHATPETLAETGRLPCFLRIPCELRIIIWPIP
jgi:hypothetical protein